KSLRGFYVSLGGVQVDISILHNADNFVEILDPAAVLLYFTPPPPTLPPNTNMVAAVKLFDLQLEKLEDGPQPLTKLTKIVKPVPLQEPGELQAMYSQHAEALEQALSWLNLSIEGKHKQGLGLLAKEKEMLYLVMDGDATHLDFSLPHLNGTFEAEADVGIASSAEVLERVREGEKALQQQLEEDRHRRELERRLNGEKPSKCGDSVPLLEWPEAVSCWLDEILAGPLIVPAEDTPGEEEGSNESIVSERASAVNPGEITLSKAVITLRDRITASIAVPPEMKVDWNATGPLQVVPQQDGKVSITPTALGVGTVQAVFDDGSGPRTVSKEVRVVGLHAFLRQETTGDFTVGSSDELPMLVEIRNAQDELMELNTTLQVFADSSSVLAPAQVQIQGGKGTFSVRPGQTARVGSVSVG